MLSQVSLAHAILAWATCTIALPATSWVPWAGSPAKAVYVMTNDVNSNAIIAMSVGKNGMLSGGSSTATGGKGSNLIDADGKIAFPDALSVQDSVVRAGDYLFAVNAGSNTLSMFAVSPQYPMEVKLLGEPQNTNGVFPVSVAISLSLKLACVGNTGIPSGVACAYFNEEGLSTFDDLRAMDFGATQNPPLGPTPGVGDMFFSEDETSLVVMVKGNKKPAFKGFAAKFAVQGGMVATTGTKTTPPSSGALFGTALIPGSPDIIFTSDASLGSLTLKLSDLAAPPIAITNVTGQVASCWAVVSSVTGTGFITDAAKNRLLEVEIFTGKIITEFYPPNPFNGMTDFRAVGNYMWALSAGNGTEPASVTTFDIGGGPGTVKQVSIYAIPGAGVNTMGLATI